MIDGPPPGALVKLVRAWREYVAWWMLERLSPPARTTRAKSATPEESPGVDRSYLNGEVHDHPSIRRAKEAQWWRESA